MKDEGGYTLLEILAAIVILGIILTVFFQLFVFSQKTTTDNREQLTALKIAETHLEKMVSDKELYRDDLINKGHVTINDVGEKKKYKVVIKTIEVKADLGLCYVAVKVFRKDAPETEDPLSEVKGLIEL